MKLTFFLLTVAFVQLHAHSNAQSVTISGKDLTLKQIFAAITKQTGYRVLANKILDEEKQTISLSVYALSLTELLDIALKDQPFKYMIEGKTIFLSAKQPEPAPVPLVSSHPAAEPIKGLVRDSLGQPLSGATVMNKRSKKSVGTNLKGEFSIEADEGDVLAVSYIGFENQNVKVSGNSLYVVMKRASSPLDEVQVVAYGTTSRRLNTGNVTTIKSEEIARHPVGNVLLVLQGRVPNLSVTPQSGNPGARINLQLRGQNSLAGFFDGNGGSGGLTGATTPLIIIDGVPQQTSIAAGTGASFGATGDMISALSFLNPNSIESVDVLADADATAIYGSRGANGVILITTKKAKAGRTSINVGFDHGFSIVPKKNLTKTLNTQQYIEMRREAYLNDGLPVPDANTADKNSSNYDLTLWDTTRYTDWQKELLGARAPWTSAYLSLSGGTEFVQYSLSAGHMFTGYTLPRVLKKIPAQKDVKNNIRLSVSGTSPNRKLALELGFTYGFGTNISGRDFTHTALKIVPNAPALFQPDGELNWEPNATGYATWANPLAASFSRTETKSITLSSNASISYQLLPGLLLKISGGYNSVNNEGITLTPLSYYDPATVADGTNKGGTSRQFNTVSSWIVEPRIDYRFSLLGARVNLIAGATAQGGNSRAHSIWATGYNDDALLLDLSKANMIYAFNRTSADKKNGVLAKLGFNWLDKYLLNINLRRDGSSRFGPGRQYGNFGSIGGAWIYTAENFKFMKQFLPFISFGKIRGSFGVSGNDGIGDYKYLELYHSAQTNNTYQGMPYIESSGVANENYAWEESRQLEVGLEFGFFKNRVMASASYWRNRSGDQLTALKLPAIVGPGNSIVANQPALIQNSGCSFSLDINVINKNSFRWVLSTSTSWQSNKLLKIPENFLSFDLAYAYKDRGEDPVGKPFTALRFLREYRGLNPTTGVYQYSTKDGTIATEQWQEFTNAKKLSLLQPTLNVRNTFTIHSLSISADLIFVKQKGTDPLLAGWIFQGAPGNFYASDAGGIGNQPVEVLNRWRKPGDIAKYQRFTTQRSGAVADAYFSIGSSDVAIIDASYIRLTNFAVSYDISKLVKKLHANAGSISFRAANLLTFSPFTLGDPSTQSPLSLPMLRTVTAGINIIF